MSIFVLVGGRCGSSTIYAAVRGVHCGIFHAAICDDATSDGPHCKVRFGGFKE